ncbi:hypothetical protein HK102_006824, partial [Quaeritorhiza haematococci]
MAFTIFLHWLLILSSACTLTTASPSTSFNVHNSPHQHSNPTSNGPLQLRAMPWYDRGVGSPTTNLYARYMDPSLFSPTSTSFNPSDCLLWFRIETHLPSINLDNMPEVQSVSWDPAQPGMITLHMNSTEVCGLWPKGEE